MCPAEIKHFHRSLRHPIGEWKPVISTVIGTNFEDTRYTVIDNTGKSGSHGQHNFVLRAQENPNVLVVEVVQVDNFTREEKVVQSSSYEQSGEFYFMTKGRSFQVVYSKLKSI